MSDKVKNVKKQSRAIPIPKPKVKPSGKIYNRKKSN